MLTGFQNRSPHAVMLTSIRPLARKWASLPWAGLQSAPQGKERRLSLPIDLAARRGERQRTATGGGQAAKVRNASTMGSQFSIPELTAIPLIALCSLDHLSQVLIRFSSTQRGLEL